MLFAPADSEGTPDRVRLFPTLEAAAGKAVPQREWIAVAVEVAPCGRRVSPLWTDARAFDPGWQSPAQLHADGSVTARGPIPEPLILAVPSDARPVLDELLEKSDADPESPAP